MVYGIYGACCTMYIVQYTLHAWCYKRHIYSAYWKPRKRGKTNYRNTAMATTTVVGNKLHFTYTRL